MTVATVTPCQLLNVQQVNESAKKEKVKLPDFTSDQNQITVQEAVEAAGFGKYQIKLLFLGGLIAMAEAMEIMLLSIISPALKCDWNLENYQLALITTVVFIGMAFSATFWGWVSDKFGRKPGLIVAVAFTTLFGFVSAFSPSYPWILTFRGLAGFGLGSCTLCGAVYCEYLPAKNRGRMLLTLLFFWCIGSVFEVLLGMLVMNTLGWRWFVGFSAGPLFIFLILAPKFLPESCRFYMVTGRPHLARQTLEEIAKENGTTIPEGKLKAEQVQNRGSILELFSKDFRLTTILLFLLWFIIVFSYYGFVLFATVLYASNDPCKGGTIANTTNNETICIGLTNAEFIDLLWTSAAEIPGNVIALLLIESLGRKKTLASEMVVLAAAIGCMSFCLTAVPMTILVSVARAMALASFNTLYMYTPEVYPTRIRAIGTGTASACGRIGALTTSFVAQVASKTSVYIPIGIYGGLCLFGSVLAMLLPIETKDLDMG